MKNLMEFLTEENSYDEIMECLSITQTEVMKMADKLSLYKKESPNLEQFVIAVRYLLRHCAMSYVHTKTTRTNSRTGGRRWRMRFGKTLKVTKASIR